VYPTTNLLNGVTPVYVKYEGNREINIEIFIAASRPYLIIHGTLWIGGSNGKNVFYPSTILLHSLARVSIKNEVNGEIN
jgi:hypothetical protein